MDRSHGLDDLPEDSRVVVITRDLQAVEESVRFHWGGTVHEVPIELSRAAIDAKYSEELHVQYEELCEDPDGVIALISEHLGLEPWDNHIRLVNRNTDHDFRPDNSAEFHSRIPN